MNSCVVNFVRDYVIAGACGIVGASLCVCVRDGACG